MDKFIDLRSDTVTKPSKAMRDVIASSEVGDDVFGEDPTVNKLQDMVAELLGKESALFVCSGTMGNQLCIKAHTETGDEIIVEKSAHIFLYETAAPSIISSVQIFPISGNYGMMKLKEIEDSIRPDIYYFPKTRLICLENTHNKAGGTVIDLNYIKDVKILSDLHGLKMHLDGARLWNASVQTGISLHEYAKYFDSVSVCLSKGLGAPVGSVIAGTKEFIEKAKKFRKILGGGLRQVGILASAGIYAIENNFKRMAEDHTHAKEIATCLSKINTVSIDLNSVQTNMVIFGFKDPKTDIDEIMHKLKHHKLLVSRATKEKLRIVTHLDINDEDVCNSNEILSKLLS